MAKTNKASKLGSERRAAAAKKRSLRIKERICFFALVLSALIPFFISSAFWSWLTFLFSVLLFFGTFYFERRIHLETMREIDEQQQLLFERLEKSQSDRSAGE